MAYVIKRYSNRKLYDTQESRYVTLEEIEEMIRGGREISVVDATSGEDLTSVTLTQIILENERNRRANLPSAFLHQLIKHGEAWQDFVQRTMRSSPYSSTACVTTSMRGQWPGASPSGFRSPGRMPSRKAAASGILPRAATGSS